MHHFPGVSGDEGPRRVDRPRPHFVGAWDPIGDLFSAKSLLTVAHQIDVPPCPLCPAAMNVNIPNIALGSLLRVAHEFSRRSFLSERSAHPFLSITLTSRKSKKELQVRVRTSGSVFSPLRTNCCSPHVNRSLRRPVGYSSPS